MNPPSLDFCAIGAPMPAEILLAYPDWNIPPNMKAIRVMCTGMVHPERVTIEWVSGAEGPRFAETVTELTEKRRALSPNMFNTNKKEVTPCREKLPVNGSTPVQGVK